MARNGEQKIWRIIDANFNRSKEALRVCEDVCRFIYDYPGCTRKYKNLRHRLTQIIDSFPIREIIGARDIQKDVGRRSILSEFERKKIDDIYYANSQRVKESMRVLEEFSKLIDKQQADKLKKLRYKIYALEKEIVRKIHLR